MSIATPVDMSVTLDDVRRLVASELDLEELDEGHRSAVIAARAKESADSELLWYDFSQHEKST